MIPSYLTEGMSTVEVLIVLLCSRASEYELQRIRDFLQEWRGREQ